MHREDFSDLYCLAGFIVGTFREDDFDGTCGTHTHTHTHTHARARVGRREYPCKFRLGNLKEIDSLKDVSINGRRLLTI